MTVAATGDWTQAGAPGVLADAARYVEAGTVDLAQLGKVDSAGVAVALELKRRASKAGKPLRFVNAPRTLVTLAAFFGVEAFLLE